ncbi:membrane protein [Dokdonia pacifica]|uniref:Predicted arabinose efflux permease, MFS family n=1 Tax=Dokdonia pacifica TaxID=1627892 RepID=A0A238WLE3_9FLAO|nr:MFS transporter [Dokdonia pacifica]GGG22049.1 membrane protein [Dokdonia pacifica]SNR47113.1 Predicted arabinose efflux permease, MFS family [Dokdonia pacifica]
MINNTPIPKWILPVIVVSQFCGTSLWFSSNAILQDLIIHFSLPENTLAHITSAVQFGFIAGTLLFAIFTIADRFSPSKVFLISAFIAAIFNLAIVWNHNSLTSILILRFLTGFFLAGIYPVGMKIAADYYNKGLGKSLGFLVGALVLGTAFPHILKGFTEQLPWKTIVVITSIIALLGGLLLAFLVPDGPYRKKSATLDFSVIHNIFKNKKFKAAAFGYFGHMWELYAFWAFVPMIIASYNTLHPESTLNIAISSFIVIGIGAISCIIAGYVSLKKGTKKTATIALALSGVFCFMSPLLFEIPSQLLFMTLLAVWGMVVIADSPLFSTLVAQNADPVYKGTALTIVNCIGFAITIVSIQLLLLLQAFINPSYLFLVLGIGPLFGLISIYRKRSN